MKSYLCVAKIKIQTALAYRFDVISTILIQCLVMYAMSCFWIAAYNGTETVSGVSQQDMITYTTISVIMGNLLTIGVQDRIAESVQSGDVALDLLKPVSIYGIYLAEDLGDCCAAFFQKAIPLLLAGTVIFGFPAPASFTHFLLFLFSFTIGYLINRILAALLGLCAFKTLHLGPLANAKSFIIRLLSGNIFPLWLFPAGFQRVLEMLPFMNIYQLPLGIYPGCQFSFSASYLCNPVSGAGNGCGHALFHAGSLLRRLYPEHLHPRYHPDAGGSCQPDGQLHGAKSLKEQKNKGSTGQTFLKSPPSAAFCYPRMGQQWVRKFPRPHKPRKKYKNLRKTTGFPEVLELVG